MTRLRIHRRENYNVDRYHNKWFADFTDYLRERFDVDYRNYDPDENGFSHVLMENLTHPSFGKSPPLSDVDMIIENLDNGEHKAISFTEYFNSWIVHHLKSPRFKGLLLTHFNYHHLYYWLKRDNVEDKLNLVKPWIFPIYNNFDVEEYRKLRDESDLQDGLFFKGSGCDPEGYRRVISIMTDRYGLNTDRVPFNEYMNILSTSKVALAYYQDMDKYVTPFDYPGEFCYRDMEYMSLGVPFIRVEYRDSVHNGLHPNHHYISINRETAYKVFWEKGNEGVAELLYNKYLEVKDDLVLLQRISENQRKYFDEYVRWPKSAELAYKLLNMSEWENNNGN